jgi:hypothetical protein
MGLGPMTRKYTEVNVRLIGVESVDCLRMVDWG